MNPARIGTSEAELRRTYAAARARLYSVPDALKIADKLAEERSYVQAATERVINEIEALREQMVEFDRQVAIRDLLVAQSAARRLEAYGEDADPHEVIETFVAAHKTTLQILLSQTRVRKVTDLRQKLYYELASRTRLSFTQIGAALFKDHTTVAHGIDRYCERTGLPHPRGLDT